jgi:hypothetical protein
LVCRWAFRGTTGGSDEEYAAKDEQEGKKDNSSPPQCFYRALVHFAVASARRETDGSFRPVGAALSPAT